MDIFVYGTLLIPEIYQKVTGLYPNYITAQVAGYRRVSLVNRVYPGIIKADGEWVNGALIKNVSESELNSIIEYEGEEYQCITIDVTAQEKTEKAYIFILPEKHHHLAENKDWNLSRFKENYKKDDFRDL